MRARASERGQETLRRIVAGDTAEAIALEDDAAIARCDMCIQDTGLYAGVEADDGDVRVEFVVEAKGRGRRRRGGDVNFCSPDAAKGIVGECVHFFCGIPVNQPPAECDADTREAAACGSVGKPKISLGIGAVYTERTL